MTAPLTPGAVIKGKYRLDRMLGHGAMGFVVAAHHLALDRLVAIKFLHPATLARPAVVERFAREARAASKIESDHVARVMDVDALDDGTPFMVMEHLEGSDLSSVRRGGHGLPVAVAVTYLLEACEAITEAHRMGIIHRDLKPANLFLARRSDGRTRIKLLDFGISKITESDSEPSMTQTTGVVGSCWYMSPEQMLASRDVDGRTDIWSLGVTLFELLTARLPFASDTMAGVCAQVMAVPARPPSALRPELPPELDSIVLRCLEKDRERRYASVGELADALAPFAPPAAVGPPSLRVPASFGARPSVPPPFRTSGAGAMASSDVDLPRLPTTSLRPLAIGATLVSVVAIAGVLFALREGVAKPVGAAAPISGVVVMATHSMQMPAIEATAATAFATPASEIRVWPSDEPASPATASAQAAADAGGLEVGEAGALRAAAEAKAAAVKAQPVSRAAPAKARAYAPAAQQSGTLFDDRK